VTISNTGLVDPIEKKLVKKKKDRIMIAWVAYQRRVESLSRYCDLNVYYIHYKWEEKSKLYKPLSYIFKMVQTAFTLFRTNAKIVFIQLPPTFPLYILVFYCGLKKAVYICDCHNTTFYDGPWIKFPFAKKMLRNSAVVLVHNEDIEEKVKDWGFPHMLLRDPIPQMSVNENIQTVGGIKIKQDKYVIFPGSFGTDEPLEELFDAMRLCPEVLFACTWFSEKLSKEQQKTLPANLRLTPAELRNEFARLGWRRVVAFQTRNPMHRAHQELTFRAAKTVEANLLIHPSVGMTKPGDVDYFTRVRCYQLLMSKYPQGTVKLSLLPLAMRMGGPREAIWHALIRKNHGVTHFIVGRDHAGPGSDRNGKPFYGPYEAQELFKKHEADIGVTMVPFNMMVYLEDQNKYVPDNEVPSGARVLNISGTELRQRLNEGREIPGWFTYPEVVHELRRSYPPRHQQGVTIFFTGLSGSGKSTIANVLLTKFLEVGGRPVTILDGDLVRKHLSSELGFSKEHRDINIRRIGYVASEITKNGGIAICAPIAPYDSVRKQVRHMIEPYGGFILVHIATPVETCEQRDRKGLYAKARAGIIKEFTGISDPYEAPADAEVTIDTAELTAEEAAQEIILHLEREGFIGVAGASA